MDNPELLRFRARVFKALSDRTRLEIIEFLKDGEKCVCEIMPKLGKAQSTTSKNLDILYEAGILDRHVDGKKTIYRIKHKDVFNIMRDVDQLTLKNLSNLSRTVKALEEKLRER